jgi:cytochrome c
LDHVKRLIVSDDHHYGREIEMKITLTTLAALGLLAAPAFAEGDIASGEKLFNQCQTCHIVADADGKVLAGRNAKTGPNLYAIVGRKAGSYPDFKYGDDMIAAGEKGLVWDEEQFVAYVQDPSAFLKAYLDDKKAKGKMMFKVKKESDAADLYAFISSLAPAPAAASN